MKLEARQRNPQTSLNANQVNLEFWQQGGMGLTLPKAVMLFGDNEGLDFESGLFAWDQTIYEEFNTPSFLTFTVNFTGDYTIEFDDQVPGRPDENGVPQSETLAFQFGMGDTNESNSQRVFVEVELIDPQTFHIETRRAAGLVELDFVLAVW